MFGHRRFTQVGHTGLRRVVIQERECGKRARVDW